MLQDQEHFEIKLCILELFQVRNVIEYPSVTYKFLNYFEKIGVYFEHIVRVNVSS